MAVCLTVWFGISVPEVLFSHPECKYRCKLTDLGIPELQASDVLRRAYHEFASGTRSPACPPKPP